MASRPVFMTKETAPFYKICDLSFTWNAGFARSQKQKNITALHDKFTLFYPDKKVLEISSKSMQEGGADLSAFNLKKYVPSLGKSVPVECVYHAGKVFENGGPYLDILEMTPRQAKKDERLRTSGRLIAFEFEGKRFPLQPESLFYDFLYVNALFENEELSQIILSYDGFTDIEFNPNKSIACQAKSAALYTSLHKMGMIDKVRELESFLSIYNL